MLLILYSNSSFVLNPTRHYYYCYCLNQSILIYIYHIVNLSYVLIHPEVLYFAFILGHFFSSWRISFSISCRPGLLSMNYLRFCLSGKKILVLPSFLKIIFTVYGILGCSFPCRTLRCILLYSGFHCFCCKFSCQFCCYFDNLSFFLLLLRFSLFWFSAFWLLCVYLGFLFLSA